MKSLLWLTPISTVNWVPGPIFNLICSLNIIKLHLLTFSMHFSVVIFRFFPSVYPDPRRKMNADPDPQPCFPPYNITFLYLIRNKSAFGGMKYYNNIYHLSGMVNVPLLNPSSTKREYFWMWMLSLVENLVALSIEVSTGHCFGSGSEFRIQIRIWIHACKIEAKGERFKT